MKKVKSILAKSLCITPILCTLCGVIIAYAKDITTFSVYPLWHAEPELPEILWNNIK